MSFVAPHFTSLFIPFATTVECKVNMGNFKHIELPVEIQNDFLWSVDLAVALSVLKTQPEYEQWLFANFTNIYINKNNIFFPTNQFQDSSPFLMDIFNYHTFYYIDSSLKNFCSLLEQYINDGFYAYVFLDEYYLSSKSVYHRTRFIHDSMIYGFDAEEKIFYALTHFGGKEVIGKAIFSYKEVETAYRAVYEHHLETYKDLFRGVFFNINRQNFLNALDKENIIKNIIAFNNAEDYSNVINNFQKSDKTPSVGRNVYYIWKNIINSKKYLDFADYKISHLLYEYKKNMFKAIKYLLVEYEINDEQYGYSEDYEKIVKNSDKIRMNLLLYFQTYNHNEANDKKVENIKRIKNRISNLIKNMAEEENRQLYKLSEHLKKYIPLQKYTYNWNLFKYEHTNIEYKNLMSEANSDVIKSVLHENENGYICKFHIILKWDNNVSIKYFKFNPICTLEAKTSKNATFGYSLLFTGRTEKHFLWMDIDLRCIEIDAYSYGDITFEDLGLTIIGESMPTDSKKTEKFDIGNGFITVVPYGSDCDFTGFAGYRFIPRQTLEITALGHPGLNIRQNHTINIWQMGADHGGGHYYSDCVKLCETKITPDSPESGGFKYNTLTSSVILNPNILYCILSSETVYGDTWLKCFGNGEIFQHNISATILGDAYIKCDIQNTPNTADINTTFIAKTNQGYIGPNFWCSSIGKSKNTFNISCSDIYETDGLQPDQPYTPGGWGYTTSSTYITNTARTVINDQGYPNALKTARWAEGILDYLFDVDNGDYTVKLYFAENWEPSHGLRPMDININGLTVISNFDIADYAGGSNIGIEKIFSVSVNQGQLDISFVASEGAADPHPTVGVIIVEPCVNITKNEIIY